MYHTEEHLDKKRQQELGAFYTPKELAVRMAKQLDWQPGQTVLDPTVGAGNLLIAMKEVYPELTNDLLYGVDVDPEAIKICIEKLPGGHFQVGDCLKDPLTNPKFWEKDPLTWWKESKELF